MGEYRHPRKIAGEKKPARVLYPKLHPLLHVPVSQSAISETWNTGAFLVTITGDIGVPIIEFEFKDYFSCSSMEFSISTKSNLPKLTINRGSAFVDIDMHEQVCAGHSCEVSKIHFHSDVSPFHQSLLP